jgi:hypothetical protein
MKFVIFVLEGATGEPVEVLNEEYDILRHNYPLSQEVKQSFLNTKYTAVNRAVQTVLRF